MCWQLAMYARTETAKPNGLDPEAVTLDKMEPPVPPTIRRDGPHQVFQAVIGWEIVTSASSASGAILTHLAAKPIFRSTGCRGFDILLGGRIHAGRRERFRPVIGPLGRRGSVLPGSREGGLRRLGDRGSRL